ncbi:hypothetical protein N7478_000236 [Penicillium angulare]|uniref:uncharacterized protein n=1 Tax=Penicillium angulare TaxID=116970 RepID=UPI0025411FDB|nr:uncharacterized protein N7478_000236 [Penicillium angulare]KAJ5290985.1 hypothetical protein N7478_000236 [Penicillium angulare]
MAHLGRVMRRLDSFRKLDVIDTDSSSSMTAEAPQVNLPHVDTHLNMHQITGFYDETGVDGVDANGIENGIENGHENDYTGTLFYAALFASIRESEFQDEEEEKNINPKPQEADILVDTDFNTSPSLPSHTSTSPNLNNDEAPTEWSAVGHAATGKSGRVIHNLQEEIARLTRECSLYRSRAEETQRSNEALKIQNQNMNERLRNLEQVNETNLNSISRKDRKIDELRAEITGERNKRVDAEADASKTNETMREERENHHREQARTQEIAKYHETQYEVLASTTKREKADLGRRVKALWAELQVLSEAQKTQSVCAERLDVLADQKNREVEGLKDAHEKLLASHTDYKKTKDEELRGTIERAHANNDMIDAAIKSIKQTEAEMKWAIQLNKNQVHG